VSSFVMDFDALDGRVTGLLGVVNLLMDPDANKRAAGFVSCDGLRYPGWLGGRVSSVVMDSDVLGGRVPGCCNPRTLRCPEWTGCRVAGLLGAAILVDSDILDERVAGCCDPRDGLRCPERTGVRVRDCHGLLASGARQQYTFEKLFVRENHNFQMDRAHTTIGTGKLGIPSALP
jgi:hypothetical protein